MRPCLLLTVLATGLSAPVFADEATITVYLVGEAFLTDPQVSVLLDGVVLTAATLDNALDTTAGERFDPAQIPSDYLQTVETTFERPTGSYSIAIRSETDNFDPETFADTNAFVVGVSIDGKPVPLASFVRSEPQGALPPENDRYILLMSIGSQATLSIDAPACATETDVALVGYPVDVLAPTPEMAASLDALVTSLGEQVCRVEAAGYASLDSPGAEALNLEISRKRAQAALDYLKEQGVEFSDEVVQGKGSTSEFGVGSANRRVVVSVHP